MTCLHRYPQLSDLSRGDGKGGCGRKAGASPVEAGGGWCGGGVSCERAETLLSPVAGLGIALSLLVRELMQLSVLILESSFYSSLFFSPRLHSFATLFSPFRSAVIRAVPANDKKYIRSLDFCSFLFNPPPPPPARPLRSAR